MFESSFPTFSKGRTTQKLQVCRDAVEFFGLLHFWFCSFFGWLVCFFIIIFIFVVFLSGKKKKNTFAILVQQSVEAAHANVSKGENTFVLSARIWKPFNTTQK